MWDRGCSRAKDGELVVDSLVHRCDACGVPGRLVGTEGSFSLCTFNYVDALARSGRLDEARLLVDTLLTYDNHVGLHPLPCHPRDDHVTRNG